MSEVNPNLVDIQATTTSNTAGSSTAPNLGGSFRTEFILALDRAFISAIGAFTATVSTNTITDGKAAATAGIAAGVAFLISIGNSARTLLGGQN